VYFFTYLVKAFFLALYLRSGGSSSSSSSNGQQHGQMLYNLQLHAWQQCASRELSKKGGCQQFQCCQQI
jgi:hypothetical protein